MLPLDTRIKTDSEIERERQERDGVESEQPKNEFISQTTINAEILQKFF